MIGLSTQVGRAFYGHFQDLRAVQREAIGPILNGDDVLILSPTGSGKTEAVTAPIVERYLAHARVASGPTIVYVTPMRALANDLLRRLEGPLETLGLLAGVRHGERNDLKRAEKPDLLITTPESLDVMLSSREPLLADVRAVLLDEVHLTYNTQRGLQLGVLLRRLELCLGRPVQVAALSATVATDAEMWAFLRPNRPIVTVKDDYSRPIDAQIRSLANAGELADLLENLSGSRKLKTLIFANSRRDCDNLASTLEGRAPLKGKVFVHHSSLSRDQRLDVEKKMQDLPSATCVATSTLELGIDIGDVDLVALFGPPFGWESFLQRIGRGNRRGTKSNVLCLAVPGRTSTFVQQLCFEALIWQVQEGRLEQRPAMDLYGAAAQQLLSLLLETQGGYQRITDLCSVFAPWAHLPADAVQEIVAGLVSADVVHRHGFLNRIGAGPPLHELWDLGLIWGNFPASSSTVPLRKSGREIGAIPFMNMTRLQPGVVIRFAGRRWQVVRVRRDGIDVENARSGGPEIDISYGGLRPPLDPANVEAMLLLIQRGVPAPHMPRSEGDQFTEVIERLSLHVAPNVVPVASKAGRHVHFTFGGQLLNEVIANYCGLVDYRAGEVTLDATEPIDFSRLPVDAGELLPVALPLLADPRGLTVFQQYLPPSILERELSELWHKSPIYGRTLTRIRQSVQRSVPLQDLQEIEF